MTNFLNRYHYRNAGLCLRPFAVGIGMFAVGIGLCRRAPSAQGRRRRCPQAQATRPSAQVKTVGIGYTDDNPVGIDFINILFSKIKKFNYFLKIKIKFFIFISNSTPNFPTMFFFKFQIFHLVTHLISSQNTYLSQTARSVTHPQIAPAQARLTSEFLPKQLPNKMLELTDISILSTILTHGS